MADEWDQFADFQASSISPPTVDPWSQFADVEQPQVPSAMAVPPGAVGQYSWDTDPLNPANMREPIVPAAPPALPIEEPMKWGQVGQQAMENLPSSAGQFATDIGTAIMHPLDTLGTVRDVAMGAVYKAVPGEQPEEKIADKIGKFYSDRYGSMEGFKKALAKDPVGILGDFATVLTGGGAAVAKAPGMAGRIGKVVATTGKAIDPLNLVGKTALMTGRGIGRGVSDIIGGLGTGTGGESLRQAAKAGFAGGEAAKAFKSGIRDTADMQDVIGQAQGALQQMRRDRGAAYRSGMVDISRDATVLDFSRIENIALEAIDVGEFKGAVKTPGTVKTVNKIIEAVDDWGKRNPAEFHTPEGLDALKQRIGDIRARTKPGKPSRLVADRIYHKIKKTIADQAPEYAKIMKDYEEASTLTREIERTFSLGEKAMADTAMRKLQSLMRDNVSTNYGNRLALAQELEKAGATEFLPALAGQTLSSMTPRGLGKLTAGGTIGGGVAVDPKLFALMPFQSPRLMGETAYYGGKGGHLAAKLADIPGTGTGARMGAYQSGRLQRLLEGNDGTDTYPAGRLQRNLRGY